MTIHDDFGVLGIGIGPRTYFAKTRLVFLRQFQKKSVQSPFHCLLGSADIGSGDIRICIFIHRRLSFFFCLHYSKHPNNPAFQNLLPRQFGKFIVKSKRKRKESCFPLYNKNILIRPKERSMSPKETIAVIDLGSLSLRLKVFQLSKKERPIEIESARRFLALGAETYRCGRISDGQLDELCEILNAFVLKLKEYRLSETICVATSAFREAANREFAIERIRLRTGLTVRILDNSEERFCHTLAVKERMDGFEDIIKTGTLILDIGAGSIQTTVFDRSEFLFSQNMLLGSLRISELLSDLEKQTPHYAEVLEEFISHDLDDYHAIEPKGVSYQNMIAFGSDIGFIKDLGGLSPREPCFLPKKKFLEICDYLRKTRPSELVLMRNIPSATAKLLLPTALIIKKSLDSLGLEGIHMPAASLCDGVLFQNAFEKYGFELKSDPYQDTLSAVRHIAKRYRFDRKHTEQVEGFALSIFDSTKKMHGLNERERFLLQLTAILHEVGKYINVTNHSTRSYHIIQTTEIIGISAEEREIIANAARFYVATDLYADRYFQYLSREHKITVAKIAAILRLADAMDASHRQKVHDISVTIQGESLQILCDTTGDLAYEQWAVATKLDLCRQVYGLIPVLKQRRPIA